MVRGASSWGAAAFEQALLQQETAGLACYALSRVPSAWARSRLERASKVPALRAFALRALALRQLRLQEPDEIDKDIDKRDFGNWLHQVLRTFHERLDAQPRHTLEERLALLDEVEAEVTSSQGLDHGEFLPFRAAWPQVRDGYLQWLQSHEAQESAVFHQAESDRERPLGPVKLVGRIDRIDTTAVGRRLRSSVSPPSPFRRRS